jgi:hypothetical protein
MLIAPLAYPNRILATATIRFRTSTRTRTRATAAYLSWLIAAAVAPPALWRTSPELGGAGERRRDG